jgi:hypothetical protein
MSSELAAELQQTIAEGLVNRTLTTCARWAEHRRVIADIQSGEPRLYSTKYHPWVRDMLNSDAPFNYSMKGAQLGVTEVVINRALYTIDRLKRDVLYVLPTTGVAQDFSRSRFKPALDLSPYLKSIFTDTNTVGLKQAGNTNLYIRGSRGESNLVSIPASVLILDEVDRMDQEKVWLAYERLSGQLRKEIWGVSTPTLPNYGIHKLFQTSTQEHYYFPCPSCRKHIRLTWPECIEIIGDSVSDPRCHESYLKCSACRAKLPQELKPEWLKPARWQVENHDVNPDVRGFHISQMYSFTVTPGDLVVAYHRGFGDELANKEFHNSKLGLPFIGDGAKVDAAMIDRCLGSHTKEDPRPVRAGRMITMGVDQGKWGYVVVKEWFYNRAVRDLNTHATCQILWQGRFYENQWSCLDTLMSEWQVMACVIDADPEINEARRFARRYPGYVWLCRYRRGQVLKEISVTDEDDAPIATVDRSNWLSATLGRYKTQPPRVSLPRDVTQEFRDHLENVVATYVRGEDGNPKLDFVSTGADHFVHAANYAEIALPLAVARQTNRDIAALL